MFIHNLKINKYSVTIVIICMCNFMFAQNYTTKQIDSLVRSANAERIKGNLERSLQMQLLNLKESERLSYSKGIAQSNYNAGIVLNTLGNYSKAIEHFMLAEQEEYTQTNLSMQSEINRFIGGSYTDLGLYKNAIEKQYKAIKLAEKEGDPNLPIRKAANYLDMGVAFDRMGSQDSAHRKYTKALYYIKNSVDQSEKFTKAEKYGLAAIITSNLGAFWNEKNNVDSAQFYFQQSLTLNKGIKNYFANFFVYNQMGDFYLKNKKYRDAIECYEKAIELSKKSKNLLRNKNPYKGIAEAYRLIGNREKLIEYSEEFIRINDSVTISDRKGVDSAVKKIVNEEKITQEQTKSKLYWIIVGIILLAILFYFLGYCFHQNMKKKKELEITEKDNIIIKKDEKAQELSMKLNTSFEEVVQLAKTNSPEFATRFQEIYPEFSGKLLMINDNLVNSELRFCALLFLNFSTKDIAEFTFTSPKTVQNRKNSIRKKLNILSEEDLYIWFKNL